LLTDILSPVIAIQALTDETNMLTCIVLYYPKRPRPFEHKRYVEHITSTIGVFHVT